MSKIATPKPMAERQAARKQVSQGDVPAYPLKDAMRIPEVLRDQYGKQDTSPKDVAAALPMAVVGGTFKMISGASVAYGLTTGAAQSKSIGLTELGRRAVAPTEEGDDSSALREACLRPRIVRQFLERYSGSPLPKSQIAFNVLENMGVPAKATERTYRIIRENASFLGFMVSNGGKEYIDLTALPKTEEEAGEEEDEVAEMFEALGDEGVVDPIAEGTTRAPQSEDAQPPRSIFLGHGKNRGPLGKIEKLLNGFKIPYRVATTEPNLGRPIPVKVRETMLQCGSAVLIFTKDEKFLSEDGKEVWRPSENVVHELGAASLLYEDRIVIFKEKGLDLASNFSSVGSIEFEEDAIDAKTAELLQELIGFGLVKITPV